MRVLRFAVIAVVFTAAGDALTQTPPAPAAPKLTLPDTVTVEPGEWAIVPFTTTGGAPKWYFPDPGLSRVALDALFGEEIAGKAKALVVKGKIPGDYRVVGYCGIGSVVSEAGLCKVVVTGPPGPPAPPPLPPVPPPTEPFARAVWDAYQTEPPATRAADAAAWGRAFRDAVTHVDVANPPIRTNADLFNDLKALLAATRPGALPAVKPVIVAEVNNVFGREPTKAIDKAAAKAELQRIGEALGNLR